MYFTRINDRYETRFANKGILDNTSRLDGRWYDRSNGEYLVIKSTRDGFMVKMPDGASRKFSSTRSDSRFKDGNGTILQVLDRNTIVMRIVNGNRERTYIRQTSNARRDDNTRVNPGTHRGNSGKVKHTNHGQSKKSCG
jgi:hypothetical protein